MLRGIDELKQLADKSDLDIIYAFGSHTKDFWNWLKGEKAENNYVVFMG
jgi:hypothetical protein